MLGGAKHESLHLIDACVELYKGSFVDDKREGFGRYVALFGFEYEGEWKDDKANGKGRKTWKGSSYELGGEMQDWHALD